MPAILPALAQKRCDTTLQATIGAHERVQQLIEEAERMNSTPLKAARL
jgi:hypothetical protein